MVEPVLAAGVGAHAAAEPVAGLEQQDVVLAQPPRRGEACDAAADHDDVLVRHAAMVDRRRSPKVGFVPCRDHRQSFCLSSRSGASAPQPSSGSFTAAADALRVSQPAVAEQVRKLERALGADLFVRAGRGVVPTDAGHAFAEHAVRTLRSLEDAAESVGELTSLRSGTVALGTFNAPAPWRLDELVATFLARHPGMTVRLVGRNSSWTAERVRRGDLEAAIVVLPIDDDRLDVRPLVRDEVLYVSAAPSGRAGR